MSSPRPSCLMICESPGKLATLKKFLNSRDTSWDVKASFGHVTTLSDFGPKRWGFRWTEGHSPSSSRVEVQYSVRGEKAGQALKALRAAVKGVKRVYLATDPDREGEAIAWHLSQQLHLPPSKVRRVRFTQITKSAVLDAVKKADEQKDRVEAGGLDLDLVQAQQARQCLDKLVGWEVSPLLWRSTGGRSAGRVQTPTLGLVCERERQRHAFVSQTYWVLPVEYTRPLLSGGEAEEDKKAWTGYFECKDPEEGPDGRPRQPQQWLDGELAAYLEMTAKAAEHVVDAVEDSQERRTPPAPFTTSSLQQEAGRRFKWSPDQTLKVAQKLYEGVDGLSGLITYMRTDSTSLAPEFVEEAVSWLSQKHGEPRERFGPRGQGRKKAVNAQEAHEAIRPSRVGETPDGLEGRLSSDQLKLYRLIYNRALASLCPDAVLEKRVIRVRLVPTSATPRDHGSEAMPALWRQALEQGRVVIRGQSVLEPGFYRYWPPMGEAEQLVSVTQGQQLDPRKVALEQRQTEPPPRYTEARLVEAMEKKGIGRPSTYASTIATLKERSYVELQKGFLIPTELGMATDSLLREAMGFMTDCAFTAEMEDQLDRIACGELAWDQYLYDWYHQNFEPQRQKAMEKIPQQSQGTSPGESSTAKKSSVTTTSPYWALSSADQEKLEKALNKAKRSGEPLPVCPSGAAHGALELRISKAKKLYWKCSHPGCDQVAWYVEWSKESCPVCKKPLEKVPSAKVKGGYFLKCERRDQHPIQNEVVLFRNRESGNWEQADARRGSRPVHPESQGPRWEGEPPESERIAQKRKDWVAPNEASVLRVRKVLSAAARLERCGAVSEKGGAGLSTTENIYKLTAGLPLGIPEAQALESSPSFGSLRDVEAPLPLKSLVSLILDVLVELDALRFQPLHSVYSLTALGQELMKGSQSVAALPPAL